MGPKELSAEFGRDLEGLHPTLLTAMQQAD
jgi:hypothetical protein